MEKTNEKVMLTLKSDVIPTKETVDYNRIYTYTCEDANKYFTSIVDGVDLNRKLDQKHVREIYNEFMNIPYGIVKNTFGGKYIAPIRVDINTYTCIDGNHTKAGGANAWKDSGTGMIRVIFEDIPKEYLKEIIKNINNTQKHWGIGDFTAHAINTGDKDVVNLNDFAMSHPLCLKGKKNPTINIRYTGAFIKGCNVSNEIKGGTLTITKKEMEFAEQIYKEIDLMIKKLTWRSGCWLETFIFAWWNIRKNDAIYNKIINEIGIKTIAEYINENFNKIEQSTKKTYWEQAFRTAIFNTQEKVINREWSKVV